MLTTVSAQVRGAPDGVFCIDCGTVLTVSDYFAGFRDQHKFVCSASAGPAGAFEQGREAATRQRLFNRIAPAYDQVLVSSSTTDVVFQFIFITATRLRPSLHNVTSGHCSTFPLCCS